MKDEINSTKYNLVLSDHPSINNGGVTTVELFAFKNHRYKLFKRVCEVSANGR